MCVQRQIERPGRWLGWLLAAAVLALHGCGSKPGDVAVAPTRSGEVWQVDPAADRAATAGAVLAYVNGLHVIVLDGDDVYAGMSSMKAPPQPDGRVVTIGPGLEARLVAAGPERTELRFSTGESVAMVRKHDDKERP
jgi:hypothetical protein